MVRVMPDRRQSLSADAVSGGPLPQPANRAINFREHVVEGLVVAEPEFAAWHAGAAPTGHLRSAET
jgi:hypothetical protein